MTANLWVEEIGEEVDLWLEAPGVIAQCMGALAARLHQRLREELGVDVLGPGRLDDAPAPVRRLLAEEIARAITDEASLPGTS